VIELIMLLKHFKLNERCSIGMNKRNTLLLIAVIITGGYFPASANAEYPLTDPEETIQTFTSYSHPGWQEVRFIERNPVPQITITEQQRGFLLFSRPITDPIYSNTNPMPRERCDKLSAFATPGEFEPVTIALYPVRDLKNISVSATDLKSEAEIIPSRNIDIRLVTFYDIRFPLYRSTNTFRRMPELLEKVKYHSCLAHECQRYWVIIKVPESARGGLYEGQLSIICDGLTKAITIPLEMKVFSFKLKRDPNKQFTAFNYDILLQMDYENSRYGRDEKKMRRIAVNEYRAMLDYGFTMPPTFYIDYDLNRDKYYLKHPEALRLMAQVGLRGSFIFVVMDVAHQKLYKKYTGEHPPKQYNVQGILPVKFYSDITRLTREFEELRKKNNWPEFIYLPLDEVSPDAASFGTQVYRAVKNAGVKIWMTTLPDQPSARLYDGYVNVWCCTQEFLVPYEQAAFDKKYKYWCYPNYQACSLRIPRAQCKGGRMTWGFGFWRSGFTGLIPWTWRWDMQDPFNYLDDRISDCGFKIAQDGSMIPTTYWECIREGIDDGRYIYTLQQAIAEREDSPDPACKKLIAEGKKLLRAIWDRVDVQSVYLLKGIWPSEEFNTLRRDMAVCTEQLLKYSRIKDVQAPSVLIE
jgi:hypothetical protein